MTKVGTRFGLSTLIIVCLVAAAGVAAMRGTWQGPWAQTVLSRGDELVSFIARFEPAPRKREVTITVRAGSHNTSVTILESPFIYEAMVKPGTLVNMVMIQAEEGFMECKIRKGFKRLALQNNTKLGGHQVFCEATT